TYTLAALPMLMLLLTLFSLLVMPVINAVSRKFEWDADRYVLEHESGETFASALEKIGEMNVADRNPHPLYECIFYSHPSIAKRIAYARTYQSQDQK
ncbi:MAG: M48 family metalloprotease, partial [Spirochaetota bacterium]